MTEDAAGTTGPAPNPTGTPVVGSTSPAGTAPSTAPTPPDRADPPDAMAPPEPPAQPEPPAEPEPPASPWPPGGSTAPPWPPGGSTAPPWPPGGSTAPPWPPGGSTAPPWPPGGAATAPPPSTAPPWPPGSPPGANFRFPTGLVRPIEGRYVAGVCAAIARATNTDPVLWRVLLAVLGFFGGIGFLVYLIVWLATPAEGDTASPVEALLGRGQSSTRPTLTVMLGAAVAISFGFIISDGFRAVLLGAAVLAGGVMLANRHAGGASWHRASGSAGRPAPAWPAGTDAGPAWRGANPHGAGWPAGTGPAYGGAGPQGPAVPVGTDPGPARHDTTPRGSWPATAGPPPPPPGSPGPFEPSFAGAASDTVPTATRPGPPGALGPPPPGTYRAPFAPRGPWAGGPPPHRPPAPQRSRPRSRLGAGTFSLVFIALGAVAALDLLNAVPVHVSTYFAVALATVGAGLLVGAWFGRARGLIALGLALSLGLGIASAVDSGGVARFGNDATWQPASVDDLATRYENKFASSTLDLTRVDFNRHSVVITVVVEFGDVTVILPPHVDVTGSVDVQAGHVDAFGTSWGGVDNSPRPMNDLGPDGKGGGDIRLDLQVRAGNAEVRR